MTDTTNPTSAPEKETHTVESIRAKFVALHQQTMLNLQNHVGAMTATLSKNLTAYQTMSYQAFEIQSMELTLLRILEASIRTRVATQEDITQLLNELTQFRKELKEQAEAQIKAASEKTAPTV